VAAAGKFVPEIVTILGKAMEPERVLPFARFMELALYCPKIGYYERPMTAPGRAGDFFTSVSVGPLFGRLLAADFSGRLAKIAAPSTSSGPAPRLHLVEAGAHDGRLALDILSWFEETNSPLQPRLEYVLIEPSDERQAWQKQTLSHFANRVRWCRSPEELGGHSIDGVIFSNELLDAFPVTRLRWNAARQEWKEMGVTGPEGKSGPFVWAELPSPSVPLEPLLASAGLEIPPALAAVLPEGFTLDLAEGAGRWWAAAARALRHGSLLTIDYGLTAPELLHPSRAGGTLRAYHDHHPEPDLLARPGEQDLTSHVNFTQLQMAGTAAGLSEERFCSQAEFLGPIALELWRGAGPASVAETRQFQTLTHPEHLGARFRVLIQARS
jgi:SAM-dependent MidA family methyltransferase